MISNFLLWVWLLLLNVLRRPNFNPIEKFDVLSTLIFSSGVENACRYVCMASVLFEPVDENRVFRLGVYLRRDVELIFNRVEVSSIDPDGVLVIFGSIGNNTTAFDGSSGELGSPVFDFPQLLNRVSNSFGHIC